jgi:hypothetical protein
VNEIESTVANKRERDPSGFFHFRPQISSVGGRLYYAGVAFSNAHAPSEQSPAFDPVMVAAGPAIAASQALEPGSESVTDWMNAVETLVQALQAAT